MNGRPLSFQEEAHFLMVLKDLDVMIPMIPYTLEFGSPALMVSLELPII